MCMFIPYMLNSQHLIRATLQTISHNNNLVFPLLMCILISVLHWLPMRILTSMAKSFFNAMKYSQTIKYIRKGKISNISESVLACTNRDYSTLQHISARQTPLHSNIYGISGTSKSAKNVNFDMWPVCMSVHTSCFYRFPFFMLGRCQSNMNLIPSNLLYIKADIWHRELQLSNRLVILYTWIW